MKNPFQLTGQTAAVIGGSGSLGGAMALALGQAGARVAIVGRNEDKGLAACEQLASAGVVARFFRADALSREELTEALDAIVQNLGPVSVLLNAAGGNHPEATLPPGADFCQLPLEAWQHVFNLNLVGGVLLPCQVFGSAMLAAGSGSIINIASLSGMTPLSRVVAYSAAKAAVLNLTQFLAREWATRGVRVNALSPGFFPAEQNRRLLFNEDGSLSVRGAQIVAHTPMARFGNPEELGPAAVFLASSKASGFVTGQNLVIDGGFSSTTI